MVQQKGKSNQKQWAKGILYFKYFDTKEFVFVFQIQTNQCNVIQLAIFFVGDFPSRRVSSWRTFHVRDLTLDQPYGPYPGIRFGYNN